MRERLCFCSSRSFLNHVHKHLGASTTGNIHIWYMYLGRLQDRVMILTPSKTLHSQVDCSVRNISGKEGKGMGYFFKMFLCPSFPIVVIVVSVLFQSNL